MRPLVWMRLVRDSDLSQTTRAVAWAIGLRADMRGGCYPSYGQVAQDTGMHRATVIRCVKCLVDGHWLIAVPRCNGHGPQSNAYQILDPSLWTTAPDDSHLVAQDDHLVAQDDLPGGRTGRPIRGLTNEVSANQPLPPVDNAPLAAVLNLMGHQTRLPR